MNARIILSIVFLTCLYGISGCREVSAQRDYFTDSEIDLIRDAQDIHLRIGVLTHAIDRRFGVLKLDVSSPANGKESEKWGPLPEGTRLELFTDIKRILQKAIDDIDDTAAHAGTPGQRVPDEPPTKQDKADPPFNRAVRELAAAAERYKPVLESEAARSKDEVEKGPMLDSIEFCDEIIEARSKVH